MMRGMWWFIVEVLESCMRSPSMSSLMSSVCGSGISSFVTSQGPIGAKVSKVFWITDGPTAPIIRLREKSLALTSFRQV